MSGWMLAPVKVKFGLGNIYPSRRLGFFIWTSPWVLFISSTIILHYFALSEGDNLV